MEELEELKRENLELKQNIEEMKVEKKRLCQLNASTKHRLKLANIKLKEKEKPLIIVLDLLEDIETSLLEILSRQKYTEPAEDCLLMRIKKMIWEERKKL